MLAVKLFLLKTTYQTLDIIADVLFSIANVCNNFGDDISHLAYKVYAKHDKTLPF